jgi:hypothetical protein
MAEAWKSLLVIILILIIVSLLASTIVFIVLFVHYKKKYDNFPQVVIPSSIPVPPNFPGFPNI